MSTASIVRAKTLITEGDLDRTKAYIAACFEIGDEGGERPECIKEITIHNWGLEITFMTGEVVRSFFTLMRA